MESQEHRVRRWQAKADMANRHRRLLMPFVIRARQAIGADASPHSLLAAAREELLETQFAEWREVVRRHHEVENLRAAEAERLARTPIEAIFD